MKKWNVSQVKGFFIGILIVNPGFFIGDQPMINSLISPYEFLMPFLVTAVLFVLYIYVIIPFYYSVLWNEYETFIEEEASLLKKISAIILHDCFQGFVIFFNLIFLYEILGIKLSLDTPDSQFVTVISIGFPLVVWFVFDKVTEKNEREGLIAEEYAVVNVKPVNRNLNKEISLNNGDKTPVTFQSDNRDLKNFILNILISKEYQRDLYHQDYKNFVISDEECISFSKLEIDNLNTIKHHSGVNAESVKVETLNILERNDTDFCTSVIYEYEYEFELDSDEASRLSGKVISHSIMVWTERGWLCLSDTEEVIEY